MFDILFTCYWT